MRVEVRVRDKARARVRARVRACHPTQGEIIALRRKLITC
jgi:hypothetical protein